MKKSISIVIFLLIGLITFAQQQDSSKYVTNSNVEKLVDKYSTKIEAAITSLSEALKQPAEHVYQILVKQQRIKSLGWLTCGILLLIPILFFRFWLNKMKEDKWGNWDIGLIFLCMIPSFLGLIILIIQSNVIYSGFFNPEYGAIKDLVQMLKF